MDNLTFLKNIAYNLRVDSIRATTESGAGHPTSCMSAADIVATVFFKYLKYDLKNPKYLNNDRFIISKGHAIPLIYAAYKYLGVINDEQLLSLRKVDSDLEGHPTPRFAYNEAATGSLGQGLAIGVGMAINAKYEGFDYKTYVLLGDGELAEGSVWEAAQIASKYKLDNLITIVDCNRLGQSGQSIYNHDVENYGKKFEAFGFKTFVIDGHDITQISLALENAFKTTNQPIAIIAKTFKGYGLPEIADKIDYHGKPFKKEELEKVLNNLKEFFKINDQLKEISYIPARPTEIKNNNLDLKVDFKDLKIDLVKKISTRKAFGLSLAFWGKQNNKIFTVDADVKNSTYTDFFEQANPNRFIQSFIAEQSMIGIATGLALRDKIPFAATFGAFLTRAHDQIRMGSIGKVNLRICGSHCGVSIGQDGPSQMALEDISMFNTIQGSIIFYPSDGLSTHKLTKLMSDYNDGISYIRTTRADTDNIYKDDEEFVIGGCKVLHQSNNDQVCIIAAGITLHESLKAYKELLEQNIKVSVIDLYSVKPIDLETIIKVARKSCNKILTVEDHYINGGIGQIIASALCNYDIEVKNLAVQNISRSGQPEELLSMAKIDSVAIKQAIYMLTKSLN